MNRGIPSTASQIAPSPTPPASLPRRVLVAATLIAALAAGRNASADSFFDIFVDAWNGGQVVMQPVASAEYPFPPPPLNFPDLGAAGTVDIEMVSLSLRGSQPLVVSPPEPSGEFTVDSFFDIVYEISASDGSGPPAQVVDSFFDIAFQIEVLPGRVEFSPGGDEIHHFDIEMVSLGLSSSSPITLPGGTFDLAIQLLEGQAAALDGHVTVLKLAGGGGGGPFAVDSFFDIFVELSIDGGPPVASTEDSQLRMASHVTVPEPSSFALAAIGLGAALLAYRRRQR